MEENKTQQNPENEEIACAVAETESSASEAPAAEPAEDRDAAMEENAEEESKEEVLDGEALADAVAEIDTTTEDAELTEDGELKYEITADGEMSGLTEAQRKRAEIFDKITTGILAFLLASPVLILLYIILWFILKN